jgi:hypothetical protein
LSIRELPDDLTALVGQRISHIRRVLYVGPDGHIGSTGAIELSCASGKVVVLDSGADGESIRVSDRPWEDPLGAPLSPQNRAWVDKAGKWAAFDVSGDPRYSPLVGELVTAVEPISEDTTITGVVIRTPTASLNAHVEFDDMVVTLS